MPFDTVANRTAVTLHLTSGETLNLDEGVISADVIEDRMRRGVPLKFVRNGIAVFLNMNCVELVTVAGPGVVTAAYKRVKPKARAHLKVRQQ